MENLRNHDGIGENELLVASFGTSFTDNRIATIGAIEDYVEKNFEGWSVRRAFTSGMILRHVKKRDGIIIDDVEAALKRAKDNGVKNLVIQPTHIMNGHEYYDVYNAVKAVEKDFEKVSIGRPLLFDEADFEQLIKVLLDHTKEYNTEDTAICYMGHGTDAESNMVYDKLQKMLINAGHNNYYIGTVEAEPDVDMIINKVKLGTYKNVVLLPLMVVAGDHANNDMAGDEEDSWKTLFTNAGYNVTCVLTGLGEIEGVQQMYVEHAKAAVEKL